MILDPYLLGTAQLAYWSLDAEVACDYQEVKAVILEALYFTGDLRTVLLQGALPAQWPTLPHCPTAEGLVLVLAQAR